MDGHVEDGSGAAVLSSGHGLVESVRWHRRQVWFADWGAGTINRVGTDGGGAEVAHRVQSLPLCFDFEADRIVVVDGPGGRLLHGPAEGPLEAWVEFGGLAVSVPNEVQCDGAGGAWVNFGNFDSSQGFPDEPVGSIVHVSAEGRLREVARGLAFPNGMALTDGGGALLCAESHRQRLTSLSAEPDGGLGPAATWASTPGLSPDGISNGADGCWIADVGSSCVALLRPDAAGGVTRRIVLPDGCFSCALSPDGESLAVATARWPGAEAMGRPDVDWGGAIRLLALTP